jgi:hypothetical protein
VECRGAPPYLFSGLLKCSKCGANITIDLLHSFDAGLYRSPKLLGYDPWLQVLSADPFLRGHSFVDALA